jgi:hypothetical protein
MSTVMRKEEEYLTLRMPITKVKRIEFRGLLHFFGDFSPYFYCSTLYLSSNFKERNLPAGGSGFSPVLES